MHRINRSRWRAWDQAAGATAARAENTHSGGGCKLERKDMEKNRRVQAREEGRLLLLFVVAGGRWGSDSRAPSPDPCLPWPDLGRRGVPPWVVLSFAGGRGPGGRPLRWAVLRSLASPAYLALLGLFWTSSPPFPPASVVCPVLGASRHRAEEPTRCKQVVGMQAWRQVLHWPGQFEGTHLRLLIFFFMFFCWMVSFLLHLVHVLVLFITIRSSCSQLNLINQCMHVGFPQFDSPFCHLAQIWGKSIWFLCVIEQK